MRFVSTLALVASLAVFGAAAAQEMETMKAPPMSLAEGAMAPSPMMMKATGLPKPSPAPAPAAPAAASLPPTTRRSLLELAEKVAERAAAPSSPLAEQIPAAAPAPLLFANAPGKAPQIAEKAPTLAELYRQDKSFQANIAPSAYEAISKNPQYSDLKQLVDKAGLASALGPNFSGTLFAPNNQAFDNLAKAGGPSVSSLLSGPTSDLKKILLFHVSSTKYTDADIDPGKVVDTLLPGASLKAVLSPSGRGVEIGLSSYSGKNVGPAGADEFAGKASIFPVDAVLIPGPQDVKAAV